MQTKRRKTEKQLKIPDDVEAQASNAQNNDISMPHAGAEVPNADALAFNAQSPLHKQTQQSMQTHPRKQPNKKLSVKRGTMAKQQRKSDELNIRNVEAQAPNAPNNDIKISHEAEASNAQSPEHKPKRCSQKHQQQQPDKRQSLPRQAKRRKNRKSTRNTRNT